MLSDFWLLSDLDGTLISTPHKANGRYLPITDSPCFAPVSSWLSSGGNICIVTTADLRVMEQVYLPLRPYLKSQVECIAEVKASSAAAPSITPSTDSKKKSMSPPPRRGCLLLSLYTGAVLYWCTSDAVVMLPAYANAMHCATRESVELAAAYQVQMPRATLFVDGSESKTRPDQEMCVRGTCISAPAARRLQSQLEMLYMTYIEDILSGADTSVRASTRWLSQRYQRMWGGFLQYLELLYTASLPANKGGNLMGRLHLGRSVDRTLQALVSQPAGDKASVKWKMDYLRARPGLLTATGILRMEAVQPRLSYDGASSGAKKKARTNTTEEAACASKQSGKKAAHDERDGERTALVTHCSSVLLADLPPSMTSAVKAATDVMAAFFVDLLGPTPQVLNDGTSGATKAPNTTTASSPGDGADIAQVILLGLPLRLFSRYFRAHVAGLVRGGVSAMPQPNSVVFSKMGVSKSTALRYLLGKDRVAAVDDGFRSHFGAPGGALHGGATASPAAAAVMNFAGCVEREHGIAMGDNPQSTDYELTVFGDVPFLSMEKAAQRAERQERIQRRLVRTQTIEKRGDQPVMPDGSPAPSYVDLVSSLRHSGPMMDDRLFRNIGYVGAEEDGTAVFLKALLKNAKEAGGATNDTPLSSAVFQEAVTTSITESRARVAKRLPSSKL